MIDTLKQCAFFFDLGIFEELGGTVCQICYHVKCYPKLEEFVPQTTPENADFCETEAGFELGCS
jgi:hypothetical protein